MPTHPKSVLLVLMPKNRLFKVLPDVPPVVHLPPLFSPSTYGQAPPLPLYLPPETPSPSRPPSSPLGVLASAYPVRPCCVSPQGVAASLRDLVSKRLVSRWRPVGLPPLSFSLSPLLLLLSPRWGRSPRFGWRARRPSSGRSPPPSPLPPPLPPSLLFLTAEYT